MTAATPVVLKLIGLASGEPSEFDGQYVVSYDPHFVHEGGYAGGKLVTSADASKAQQFPSVVEAIELWQADHGWRPDGHRNRPLTAFTVQTTAAPKEDAP